jgi:hypothetical protein
MPDGLCTSYCTVLPCPTGTGCLTIAGGDWCLPECAENEECRAGYTCVFGLCRPPAGTAEGCEEDSDCASNVCEGGICSTECLAHTECPDGLYCDEGTGVCLLDDCSSGICLRDCATHDDCAEGTYCTATATGGFFCAQIPEEGGPGTLGHSCAVNDCVSPFQCMMRVADDPDGFCTTTCTADSDCRPDMVCRDSDNGNSYCFPRGFCEPCSFDGQCGFSVNRCVATSPAAEPGGAYCSTGCTPGVGACPLDSTCKEAFLCEATNLWVDDCASCTGACTGGETPEYQCFHDYGTCRSTDGALCTPCKHNGDCSEDGACLSGSGQENWVCSAPCDNDVACPDGFFCARVSGMDNQCVPRNGGCTKPSSGKDTCQYCTDLIEDCLRGWCIPPSSSSPTNFCFDECGAGFPDCPPYTECGIIHVDLYDYDFRVCVPTLPSGCTPYDDCIEACPTGPESCSASAPAYCL